MTADGFSTWVPEARPLNKQWVVARYDRLKAGGVRRRLKMAGRKVAYYDTEEAAKAVAEGLNNVDG